MVEHKRIHFYVLTAFVIKTLKIFDPHGSRECGQAAFADYLRKRFKHARHASGIFYQLDIWAIWFFELLHVQIRNVEFVENALPFGLEIIPCIDWPHVPTEGRAA